ncbi:excinuclease ABC subunit A [Bradymonas sediminis]|uniref:UvrABC system protein A n=2 Tax=Bradymonas sediminis TaxID=1548548 RepID=A0A2Z4FK53_9DELT|nr:excinuclease ABC subunit A [Bradymonas sediminis]
MPRTMPETMPNTEVTPAVDSAESEAIESDLPQQYVTLRGVRTHNLKGIDCKIPHGKLTVISGVSGSGKSSLAFDTLYAEGQRRYTESLSTYARQFLQRMERPPVEAVKNIQPALALRQKNDVSNARSTVGTITEVDDHLQLVYTHIGETICPTCETLVGRDTVPGVVTAIEGMDDGTRLILVAQADGGENKHRHAVLKHLVQEGYRRLLIDGEMVDITESDIESLLDREAFPVIIDRIVVRKDEEMRFAEAVEAAFALGNGRLEVHFYDDMERAPLIFDRAFRCNGCGTDFIEPQPALFSFNSSLGACDTCSGFGKVMGVDFKKVIPNTRLTLKEGVIACLETPAYRKDRSELFDACRDREIPLDVPFEKLDAAAQDFIIEGGKRSKNGKTGKKYKGVRGFFEALKKKQYKTHVRIMLARYRGYDRCPDCKGARLNASARNVRVAGKAIGDLWQMRLSEAKTYFDELELPDDQFARVETLLDEIEHRLAYLNEIGCGYLRLDRQSRTLSGGEMQRIHLTASLGRALTDTLYVLDEPTAGMHASDTDKLMQVLYDLRDLDNTVVVVEHDPEVIEGADYIIEIGPGGGEQGGELLFSGPIKEFRERETITSEALLERQALARAAAATALGRKKQPKDYVRIVGAREHNLADLTVEIPCGQLTAVTGLSGSGKSTLCERVLYQGWKAMKGQGGTDAGAHDALEGLERFDDVVLMDQAAVGRSSRSNSLSYTGAFDAVRKLFAATRAAKQIGLTVGDFSFNTAGGRCETCNGAGTITVEMHFMADIEVTCEDCQGKRYGRRVLDVEYRGKNIADIFDMTVAEGVEFFRETRSLLRKLEPLVDVGLGYLRMGQTTATLSGGEAQRLKLATYIADGRKRGDTKPVLFIFDEPTVGLHMLDISTLLSSLKKLVDLGHTVIVIEHNIDFIAQCDHIIDLGPGAGPAGGQLVATGTPREVANTKESVTGRYLAELLDAN